MTNNAISADQRVDVTAIERSLAELWRTEKEGGDQAVTRAALWNVVAHTSNSELHTRASETLGVASAAVPQRTITATVFDPPHMRSRLGAVARVRVVASTTDEEYFGHSIESLLYAAWLSAQLGHQVDREGKVEGAPGSIDYRFERRRQTSDVGGIAYVEIMF